MIGLTRARGAAGLTAVALAAAAAAGCGSTVPASAPATTAAKPKPAAPKAAAPKPAKHSEGPAAGVPDTLHCIDVPRVLVRRILSGVLLDGAKLPRVEAVASPDAPGYYFVSSTVAGGGAGARSLATWAASGLADGRHVYSVDAFAAMISRYGDAAEVDPALSIHAKAAYQSRVCAGGPHASRGAPAPASGIGNAPAGD